MSNIGGAGTATAEPVSGAANGQQIRNAITKQFAESGKTEKGEK